MCVRECHMHICDYELIFMENGMYTGNMPWVSVFVPRSRYFVVLFIEDEFKVLKGKLQLVCEQEA
jgi:hypothetical protein